MEITIPELQTELVLLAQKIRRLQRDIEYTPRNKKFREPQLAAAFEEYGRLSYLYDEKMAHSQTTFLRRLLRKK